MRKRSKILKMFILLCFIGYLGLSSFLIYQASLDGKTSSDQSGAIGDELSGIVNDTKGDQTVLIDPTGLVIENEIYTAKVGTSYQLKCNTLPEDASYKSLKYETNNQKIATISSTGLITFLDQGEVEISVYNKDFPNIEKTFLINVEKIELNDFNSTIKGVELDNEVYTLKQYQTYNIENEFIPYDASIKKVSYSYDKEYITISNNQLYAKKPIDLLMITLKCDGLENVLKVSIEEVIIEVVDVVDYSVSKTKINMHVNESIKLSSNPFGVQFNPINATNQNIIYTSKNNEIVTVENNKLIAKKPGVVTIEMTSQDKEIKKLAEIEVTNIIGLKENKFTLEQEYLKYNEKDDSYHIRNGLGGKISCNFTDNSTFTNVLYSSSNEKVLLVGDDGQLTPIKIGKAKILVTIDDGYSSPLTYEINVVVDGKPFIEDLSEFYYFVRKSIGHFGAFFVLGGLGGFAFLLTFDKKKWYLSLPLTIVLGFGIAALTEYIQTFVPGRYGAWKDVWLDFSGYISSTILVFVFLCIIYLIIHFKNNKTRINK